MCPLYPPIAARLVRDPRVASLDLSFIKSVYIVGCQLHYDTFKRLTEMLPNAKIHQVTLFIIPYLS
jgi:hypothetical protein